MKFVFPITQENGQEYPDKAALETALKVETTGQFGFNPSNQCWHGGLHLTENNAAWIQESQAVRAIADGKVVACRINEEYQTSTFLDSPPLLYSNDFCLLEHQTQVSVKKDDSEKRSEETFTFYSLYMHLAPQCEPYVDVSGGLRYRILTSCDAYSHAGINEEKAKLKKGCIIEDRGEVTEISDGHLFRQFEIIKNQESSVELTQEGKLVWIATEKEEGNEDLLKDFALPLSPDWMIDKITARVTNPGGLSGRSDPTPDGKAGSRIVTVPVGTRFSYQKSRCELLELGGKKRLMVRCQFIDNDIRTGGDQATQSIEAAWMCVEPQYIHPVKRTPFSFGSVQSFGSESPYMVKAGDPIGYLGRYIVPNPNNTASSPGPFYQLHFETFSKEKPPRGFFELLMSDEELEKLHWIEDKDSDGWLDEAEPPFLHQKVTELIHQESIIDSTTIIDTLTPWDSFKSIVANHGSEWYAQSDEKPYLDKIIERYTNPVVSSLIDHEKVRIDNLVWMKEETKINFGPCVWHWWPAMKYRHPVVLGREAVFLSQNLSQGISEQDYISAANELNCEVAAIKAVSMTETGSIGAFFDYYDDTVPSILFERHYFSRLTNHIYDSSHSNISNRTRGGYGKYRDQYAKLLEAYDLSPSEALMSASWGKYQIMGKNHSLCGYSSVEDFVWAVSMSEVRQLNCFVSFIKSNNSLLKAIQDKDWHQFAINYNGPAQDGYDEEMRKNYETITSN